MRIKTKKDRRERIKHRVRKRVHGTSERPRLSVFRSVSHIYVQAIDDEGGRTLLSASTLEPAVRERFGDDARPGNLGGAAVVGTVMADKLRSQGISRIVFDRGGFLYHGRVKAVADALRAAGMEF